MQISVKPPPEMTLRVLEKCATLDYNYPSGLAGECVWQCLVCMDHPHSRFNPLRIVEKYFYALGREMELFAHPKTEQHQLKQMMIDKDRARRASEASLRIREFRAQWKKKAPPKHLHLKLSSGVTGVTKELRAKADWLRMKPNTLAVACLRDCINAMDDPKKAMVPPPIVVDFWTISKAHLRPKLRSTIEVITHNSQERMIRERSGPILDTLIRCYLKEEWETTLKQILTDAGVFQEKRESKK